MLVSSVGIFFAAAYHRCTSVHKCLIRTTDGNFNFIPNTAVHSPNTRRSNDFRLPLPRTNLGKQTLILFTKLRKTGRVASN